MKLKLLKDRFAICKVMNLDEINFQDDFVFVSKTDDEISVVCNSKYIPKNATECENDWKAFKIDGVLEFSMVGVLSKLSGVLAENGISIFAISTYNTDYILVKETHMANTKIILQKNGYIIE